MKGVRGFHAGNMGPICESTSAAHNRAPSRARNTSVSRRRSDDAATFYIAERDEFGSGPIFIMSSNTAIDERTDATPMALEFLDHSERH